MGAKPKCCDGGDVLFEASPEVSRTVDHAPAHLFAIVGHVPSDVTEIEDADGGDGAGGDYAHISIVEYQHEVGVLYPGCTMLILCCRNLLYGGGLGGILVGIGGGVDGDMPIHPRVDLPLYEVVALFILSGMGVYIVRLLGARGGQQYQ